MAGPMTSSAALEGQDRPDHRGRVEGRPTVVELDRPSPRGSQSARAECYQISQRGWRLIRSLLRCASRAAISDMSPQSGAKQTQRGHECKTEFDQLGLQCANFAVMHNTVSIP